jgi:hypothetical protein
VCRIGFCVWLNMTRAGMCNIALKSCIKDAIIIIIIIIIVVVVVVVVVVIILT